MEGAVLSVPSADFGPVARMNLPLEEPATASGEIEKIAAPVRTKMRTLMPLRWRGNFLRPRCYLAHHYRPVISPSCDASSQTGRSALRPFQPFSRMRRRPRSRLHRKENHLGALVDFMAAAVTAILAALSRSLT